MTVREKLIQEIDRSSEMLLEEFLDFILFAKTRRQSESQTEIDATTYKPIWEIAAELLRETPPEAFANLPNDSAENHAL